MILEIPSDVSPDLEVTNDLQEMAKRVDRYPVPERPVIFFGSSSLRLWDPTIRDDLRSEQILNLAFGGSTLLSCHDYFTSVMKPFRQAKSVVIYAGDNDLGQGISPQEVESRLSRLLVKIEQRFGEIPIFFLSIKPSPSRDGFIDRIIESNRLARSMMDSRTYLHYVDIFEPMLTDMGKSDPRYFLEDMLHMNQDGYAIWKNVLLQWAERIGL